jgi:DNA polymerase (family 10)
MSSKKRLIFKKGRFIWARSPGEVLRLAKKVSALISPYSKRIMIAGSIRRKELKPVDIDIVLIPKNNQSKQKITEILSKQGKFILGGEKKTFFKINGIEVDLYYTSEKSWGATLLAYSSRFGSAIGLRVVARKKGFLLNQYGLFNRKTKKYIAGKTEQDIYKTLRRPYKAPELR